jgi:hypothetical protein
MYKAWKFKIIHLAKNDAYNNRDVNDVVTSIATETSEYNQ